MQASAVISLSTPSFTSYSNTEVAEIAARVVEEFGSEEYYEEFYFERGENSGDKAPATEEEGNVRKRDDEVNNEDNDDGENEEEEEEFEFAFVTKDSELSSPISADEIFYNGQIRPVYPVFNRDLFLERDEFRTDSIVRNSDSEDVPAIRLPLRKLFIEERETTMTMTRTSSSSSSEASELEGIPADSYCVWRPPTEGRCKKSSSAGGSNSKRWKLRNLLNRSHSDGSKDNFVILSHKSSGRKKPESEEKVKSKATTPALKPVAGKAVAHPPLYGGGEKRRSYLPYRQELVGIFTNANGLSKHLQQF